MDRIVRFRRCSILWFNLPVFHECWRTSLDIWWNNCEFTTSQWLRLVWFRSRSKSVSKESGNPSNGRSRKITSPGLSAAVATSSAKVNIPRKASNTFFIFFLGQAKVIPFPYLDMGSCFTKNSQTKRQSQSLSHLDSSPRSKSNFHHLSPVDQWEKHPPELLIFETSPTIPPEKNTWFSWCLYVIMSTQDIHVDIQNPQIIGTNSPCFAPQRVQKLLCFSWKSEILSVRNGTWDFLTSFLGHFYIPNPPTKRYRIHICQGFISL